MIKISGPKDIAGYIDHTILKPDATEDQVIEVCQEARKYHFASVCTYSKYMALVSKQLKGSKVKPISVVGFPTGLDSTEQKVREAKAAISAGALEIDMVINLEALKNKNYQLVSQDISEVAEACGMAQLKVIIETSQLTHNEKIAACALAVAAGANFVKTSTGFSGGAKIDDVRLMREVVGPDVGVKASGGIPDFATAKSMLEAGANRLGTSSGVEIVERLSSKKDY